MLGLVRIYSDNFVANINQDLQNVFRFYIGKAGYTFTNYWGHYSIEDLGKRFKNWLKICVGAMEEEEEKTYNAGDFKITIRLDMKLTIKSFMNLYSQSSLSYILGFGNKDVIFRPNEEKIDLIEIHCNIVEPLITNHALEIHRHEESEILYSFFPNISFKYKISDKPKKVHYISIRKDLKQIKEIIITIQNGKGNLLINNGPNNIIYLNLKAF